MTLSTLYKIKTILEAEIDDSITDFLSCKDISLQNSISEYYLNDCLQSLFEVYDEILAQDNSALTNDCLSTLKKEYLMIDKLTIILNTSMDGQITYGLQSPTNEQIAEKIK